MTEELLILAIGFGVGVVWGAHAEYVSFALRERWARWKRKEKEKP